MDDEKAGYHVISKIFAGYIKAKGSPPSSRQIGGISKQLYPFAGQCFEQLSFSLDTAELLSSIASIKTRGPSPPHCTPPDSQSKIGSEQNPNG